MIYFLQFYFVVLSNNFFAITITNNISPRHSIFNFFNLKNFFRPIWSITFTKLCKNIFTFWYSNMITNFKFSIFLIIFFIKFNICAWHYINKLHFICSMICIVVFIYNIILFINIQIFWCWSHIYERFILHGPHKSFSSNWFLLFTCWIHFYIIILQ